MEDPLLIRHERHEPHRHPTREEVATAAYYIWLQEAELPDYTDAMGEEMAVGNWLLAEAELRGRFDLIEGS